MGPKKKSDTKEKSTESTQPKVFDPPRGFWVVCIILAVLALAVAAVQILFNKRVLLNVSVGNAQASQMDSSQLKQAVQQQAEQLKVVFKGENKQETVPAKDLGMTVDVDATVKNTLLARRGSNVLDNLMLWRHVTVPLVYQNDAGVLKTYILQHFPQVYVDPQDAELVFNSDTNQFDIKPGVPGKGFDIKSFETLLPDLAANPRTITMQVQSVPVQPLITEAALTDVQQKVNQQIHLSFQFTQNGRVKYTASPAQIASWVHFTPDPSKGVVVAEFDRGQVLQFINQTVGGTITNLPVDRKVVVDDTSGTQFVVQQGSPGNQLVDTDKLADAIMASINDVKSLSQEVTVEQAPFKTVTVKTSGKWIEVDLSHQSLTLFVGSQALETVLISSGKAATPTEVGTFYIYSKTPMTTMTGTILGEYYYVPNIPWVSYFDGGEAFHGTYWHHNFGHPMSHGCVNMTIEDAKTLYDFAPIGTKVVVHY